MDKFESLTQALILLLRLLVTAPATFALLLLGTLFTWLSLLLLTVGQALVKVAADHMNVMKRKSEELT